MCCEFRRHRGLRQPGAGWATVALLLGVFVTSRANAAEPGATHIAPWRDDKRAPFVLMFDDSMPSHVNIVLPELKRRRLVGVFYVTPREPVASWLPSLSLPAGIRLTADEAAVRGRTVLWANVADFKGLERPVALVAELDDHLPSDPRERDVVLYVAFSRPRNLLAVFHTGAARGWLTVKR